MGIATAGGGGGMSTETIAKGAITMDGTEQSIIDGQDVSNKELSGRVDFDNIEADDEMIIKAYINGKTYTASTYKDALLQSQIILTPIMFGEGEVLKMTIQQTATGASGYKDVPYKLVLRG